MRIALSNTGFLKGQVNSLNYTEQTGLSGICQDSHTGNQTYSHNAFKSGNNVKTRLFYTELSGNKYSSIVFFK